jgi:transcriptional regulator
MIRSKSDDLLRIEHGSLYPALHRLQRAGWLDSEWGLTQNNQRAKFYRLTAKGKKQLLREEAKWELFIKAMATVTSPQT